MRLEAFSKRAHRLPQVGICVQFLALVRTLAEFFWLEHIEGPLLRVATVAPYVDVGLLAALPTLDRSALLLRWYKHPQWSEAIHRSSQTSMSSVPSSSRRSGN